ncbi:hypothetical protein DFJ74DRAFT_759237 [Hyaloraphidium curvatum]|nr:hypothetical protein DFJ74DRAFT_759237 [Hyaloraphidium curvatum]
MGLRRSAPAFLFAALALLQLLRPAGAQVVQRNNGGSGTRTTVYYAAQTCCPGCSYDTDCCCARGVRAATTTVTTTITSGTTDTPTDPVTPTITLTPAPTVVFARDAPRRLEARDEPDPTSPMLENLGAELVDEEAFAESPAHRLFARHLCPSCRPGVNITSPVRKNGRLLARTNGGSSGDVVVQEFCCTRPTVTVTATAVVRRGPLPTVTGRMYTSSNRNANFRAGVDQPAANTNIVLLSGSSTISSAKTDKDGVFRFKLSRQAKPREKFTVARSGNTRSALATVTADATGKLPASIRVALAPAPPAAPRISAVQPAAGGAARSTYAAGTEVVATGTSPAGATVEIYDAGVLIWLGQASGTAWSVPLGRLAPGTHTLTAKSVVGCQKSASSSVFRVTVSNPASCPSGAK